MENLNKYIEHTALKPDLTIAEVQKLCEEAMQYHFAGVCVPTYFLGDVVPILADTGIDVVTVIGFPYGYSSLISKFEEIETITKLVHAENKVMKIIIETGLMSEIEIDLICKIANEFNVDYVKTSTGVNGPGADVETIRNLREALKAKIKINNFEVQILN